LVNGTASYLFGDQLGSIKFIYDASGALARQREYRPFGEINRTSTPLPAVLDEAQGYIGERYDTDAGLQFLNARYYDPKLGLFTSPDWFEVTEPGVGTNRYAYALNDPVNASDPNGNIVPLVVGVVAVATYLASAEPANSPGPDDPLLHQNGMANAAALAVGLSAGATCMASGACLAAVAITETTSCVTGNIHSCAPGPSASNSALAVRTNLRSRLITSK
jgi:RHS repeat-associated protein